MSTRKGAKAVGARAQPKRDLKSLVERLYDAILKADFVAMDKLLSPNFTYRTADGHLSRLEYMAMHEASRVGTSDWRIEAISMTVQDDRAVDEVEISFTLDGKRFAGRYCSVCVFEDNQLYEMRSYGGVIPESETTGYRPIWNRA